MISKQEVAKEATPVKKEVKSLKWQRDKDREKVQGIFRFFEVAGGSMSFVYKAYKEDPVERYDFIDGQPYSIPFGVAKHLNKNGWYPEYGYIKGEEFIGGYGGTNGMRITKKIRRFGFDSLEFMDLEDLGMAKSIVTVEHIVN
jgi:hypothetical protein